MTSLPAAPPDRLARVLQALRLRSTFCSHSELSDPWSVAMPAIEDSISFHIVTSGTCWLHVADAEPIRLQTGDLALIPHGRGHALSSTPTLGRPARVDLLPQTFLSEHYSVLHHGGSGPRSQLICGVVSFDEPAARELARALPYVILVEGTRVSAASAIRDTVRLMADELSTPQPGTEAVASRLADIIVVQAIRVWLASAPEAGEGWLGALTDDRIGQALEAIHASPGADWTVTTLARTATMSRSAFSARFTALVGEAPMAYVTRWRMTVARARLADGGTTAAFLATELGYASEAAFHRAFVRVTGQPPGAVRRAARQAREPAPAL